MNSEKYIKIIDELKKSKDHLDFYNLNFSEYFREKIKFDQISPILEQLKIEKFIFERFLTNKIGLLISKSWRVSISFDEKEKLNYFYVIENKPKSELIYTKNLYNLPFESEWLTFWGGEYYDLNYHNVPNQYFAYDFFVVDDELKSSKLTGQIDNYYCYDRSVLAALDGKVISVVNEFEDNTNGEYKIGNPAGNYIIIEHENAEYSFYAHLKKGGFKVNVGDLVETGQQIAKCGNSGNSSEPHLHFQVMNSEDFESCSTSLGRFNNIKVKLVDESSSVEKLAYSPLKGDRIRNA